MLCPEEERDHDSLIDETRKKNEVSTRSLCGSSECHVTKDKRLSEIM